MKRIWIFVLIMLALLMCVGAAGAEVTASGTCGKNGDNLHWTLENGVMTITGTGEMADTTLLGGMPWKRYQDNITSVVIGEGATYIGECAFYNCTNLTSVTLPTTLQRIGIQAFFNCKKLPEIVVPEGVTSLAYGAFEACSVLVNATLPSTLKIMEGDVFYDCDLRELVIPEGVTDIGESAFAFNSKLSSVTMSTSLQRLGEHAFLKCRSLKKIFMPESVIVIGEDAFANCASGFTIQGAKDSYVQTYAEAHGISFVPYDYGVFGADGDNLKWRLMLDTHELTITGTGAMPDYANWTYTPWSDYHKEITSAVIGTGVTYIGKYAFDTFHALVNVTLPTTLQRIGVGAFWGDYGLTEIKIPEGTTEISDSAFNGCDSLVSVKLPTTLQRIESHAFNGCHSLKELIIPQSVTEIGKEAFKYCAEGFTIYGAAGSYAQTYAEANGIPFKDVGSIPREIRILRQPESVTVPQNTNATFSIQVESGEIYRYQWAVRRPDGVETQLDGEIYGTLTVRKAQYTQNGNSYACYVTAPDGKTVRSDYAKLTVVKVPKTGDAVDPYLLAAASALCAAVIFALLKKRKSIMS